MHTRMFNVQSIKCYLYVYDFKSAHLILDNQSEHSVLGKHMGNDMLLKLKNLRH